MESGSRLVLELFYWTKDGEELWDYFYVDSIDNYRDVLARRFPTLQTELVRLVEISEDGKKVATLIDFQKPT